MPIRRSTVFVSEPPSQAGERPRSVCVLRALNLGDLLCAVPALRALRHGLPEARISLIGLPWAHEYVERYGGYVDELIEFPGYPGLPEREPDPPAVAEFLLEMQARRFDLAIQMQGDGTVSNGLAALFGARHSAGFVADGGWAPPDGLFMRYPEDMPEVRRNLALMRFIGMPSGGEHLELPLTEHDRAEAARLLADGRSDADAGYAVVHAGARASERRWPPERFAATADRLAELGLGIVLTGTVAERPIAAGVARRMRHPALDVAGLTSLGSLGALVAGARLVMCNDTGVSHVAAALRVPSVVVFSDSDPARWAPLDRDRHRVVLAGARGAPEAALGAARELLARSPSAAGLRPVA